jgi:hypothetical protein
MMMMMLWLLSLNHAVLMLESESSQWIYSIFHIFQILVGVELR